MPMPAVGKMPRGSKPVIVISSRCARTIFAQRKALALAASQQGWDVTLAGDQEPGDTYPDRLRAEGLAFSYVPVEQGSLSPFSMLRLFVAFLRLFRRTKPLVFHAFTIKPTIVGLIAARVARVPVRIATVAGLGHAFLSRSRLKRWMATALFRIALSHAQSVNFYNVSDRDLFLRRGLLRPQQAQLMPGGSGVDTRRFVPSETPDRQRTFRAVFIGRLIREKGIGELLDAARWLRSKNEAVLIDIVGDADPNNPSSISRREIENAVAEGGVIWHGPLDDVRAILAAADVVVLPSYREGIPMVLLEAAAMAKPAITTDAPGCRDVVEEGETGLIVPVRDAHSLAEAIVHLSRNRHLAERLGANARKRALQHFDIHHVTQRMIAEYQRLIDLMPPFEATMPGTAAMPEASE